MQFWMGFFFKIHVGWWKGMKQFLPTKSAEHEETPVRYSNSEISHLRPREVPTMLQTESAGTFYCFCGMCNTYIYVHDMPKNVRNLATFNCFLFILGNRGETNGSVSAFLKMQAFSNLFAEYHKSRY